MHNGFYLYIFDTETTGLDPELNDVIEISGCRLTLEDNNINQEQKTWLLKALDYKTIQDEALKVNGHKREDICHQTAFGKENYLDPFTVIPEIEMWIAEDGVSAMDRIFAGQNPNFDIKALQALWRKVNSPETFPFALENGNRIIDTKQLAILVDICTGRRRKYYNLSSLVKAFGVKKGKAHKASEDVIMTVSLLLKFINPVKDVLATSFKDCYPDDE